MKGGAETSTTEWLEIEEAMADAQRMTGGTEKATLAAYYSTAPSALTVNEAMVLRKAFDGWSRALA